MATTMKANLFIPQVVADQIATDYGNAIVVSSYFDQDNTLVGRAGDTLTFPQFQYIGDASVIAEGGPITPAQLTCGTVTKSVVKVVKQVELTDEALNSGYGNPRGEATTQIGKAIALKDDKDAITELLTANQTAKDTTLDGAIVKGLKVLGEKALQNTVYCFVNTSNYYDMIGAKTWVPASEMVASMVTRGVAGQYMGVTVIPTDTVAVDAPILMIPGAGRKINKASFEFEYDRDLSNHTHLLDGSEHRVMYLYDESKVVKLAIGA